MSTAPSTVPATPSAFGDLVRLALGLPDPSVTLTDAVAAVGVRAGLHLDSHSASETLRVTEIVVERQRREQHRAQGTPAAAPTTPGPR
jgi:hypothetical protein